MKNLAIAYAMKKKSQKMAQGGMADSEKAKGTDKADYHRTRGRTVAGIIAERGHKFKMGHQTERAKDLHREKLSEIKSAPNPKLKGLADGGPVLDPDKTKQFVQGFAGQPQPEPKDDSGEEGLVDRIMKRFSKGGQVANEEQVCADEMPNEFDDLVLDDDLEFHDTGANSGDELGDAQESSDRKDIVARIMASRKKKDKNPRPA